MPTHALQIRNLAFRYDAPGSTPFELHVGSLVLGAGEQMLLTARSGGGKSTLLGLICGLMDPLRGTIEIDGQDIHDLRGAARDRFRGARIGVIFQTFNLLIGFSALENVLAPLMLSNIPRGEHQARAAALLERLGIERPHAKVEHLSVGQQQRVAVARAVACKPALVLADEPTASLDPENAGGAMDLIQGICRDTGAALLCVSHDPSMAQRFPRQERLDALSTQGANAS